MQIRVIEGGETKPSCLVDGQKWLEQQMEKMLAHSKPAGFWWRGKAYYVGDRLPKSLTKQLRKVALEHEVEPDG